MESDVKELLATVLELLDGVHREVAVVCGKLEPLTTSDELVAARWRMDRIRQELQSAREQLKSIV